MRRMGINSTKMEEWREQGTDGKMDREQVEEMMGECVEWRKRKTLPHLWHWEDERL